MTGGRRTVLSAPLPQTDKPDSRASPLTLALRTRPPQSNRRASPSASHAPALLCCSANAALRLVLCTLSPYSMLVVRDWYTRLSLTCCVPTLRSFLTARATSRSRRPVRSRSLSLNCPRPTTHRRNGPTRLARSMAGNKFTIDSVTRSRTWRTRLTVVVRLFRLCYLPPSFALASTLFPIKIDQSRCCTGDLEVRAPIATHELEKPCSAERRLSPESYCLS